MSRPDDLILSPEVLELIGDQVRVSVLAGLRAEVAELIDDWSKTDGLWPEYDGNPAVDALIEVMTIIDKQSDVWLDRPERTPEMATKGQVWVGMNYPDGSHGWEIRGTGARMT